MNPTVLAQYLRTILIYAVGAAAAVGAGYILLTSKDFGTALSNPIVIFASSYLSMILGFHVGITDPNSPTPAPAPAPAPPAVVTPPASSTPLPPA